jgi:hypothetical protein
MQIYKAFGLRFASEIPFPELVTDGGEADVSIRWGYIPKKYVEHEEKACFWSASSQHFYLSLKNIGKFLCQGGNTITVEPTPGYDPPHLRIFLFGSVFGAIMHQRGIFPLHASAVEKNGVAYAFTGESGSGKSTLASACLKNGYRLLCDDVCAITKFSNHSLLVQPSFPLIKLSYEMFLTTGLNDTTVPLPSIDAQKLRLLSNQFSPLISQLKTIFVLSKNYIQDPPEKILLLKGIEKIKILLKNTYRREYILPMQKGKEAFIHCTNMAQNVEVLVLTGSYQNLRPHEILNRLGIAVS